MLHINSIFLGRIPKDKENLNDCQDFLAAKANYLAIADGSSQSFYPTIWAKLLVRHFIDLPNLNEDNWQDWLAPIQEEWLSEVTSRVEIAKSKKKPVWITNQNRLLRREAATSTFVGLKLTGKKLYLSIVGDSCVFVWQKEKNRLEAFNRQSSQEFDDRPEYFGSYSKDNNFQPQFFEIELDNFELKNTFFLVATDALAEWVLKNWELGDEVFSYLLNIQSQGDFENKMSLARDSSQFKLKNDDTTLITFQISKNRINIPDYLPQDSVDDFEQVEEAEQVVPDYFGIKKDKNDYFNDQQREKDIKHQEKINQLVNRNRKIAKSNQKYSVKSSVFL
ncbi:MAG: hypothetical protein AAFO95_16750, partial [Cyanobacteria bacterium J06600_6]